MDAVFFMHNRKKMIKSQNRGNKMVPAKDPKAIVPFG